MNFLGPIGIALATVWAMSWAITQVLKPDTRKSSSLIPQQLHFTYRLANGIDYRLLLIGTLVPDIIDKPLVFAINPGFVNHSLRSVGHSLVGGILMLSVVWLVTRDWQRATVMSFGIALFAHLVMDKMWEMPESLLWPFLGYVLPSQNIPFSHWWRIHFERPPTTLIDIAGIALLILVIGRVIVGRSTVRFFKTGQWS